MGWSRQSRRGAAALRDAAVSYAAQGWSVVPGDPDCLPVAQPCGSPPGVTASQARELWTRAAHPILLACGRGIDAVEIPAGEGERVIPALRNSGVVGPIAVTSHHSWLLLVTSGGPLRPVPGTRVWGTGSWVPLPPTRRHRRPYRWRISPQAVDWAIPHRNLVRDALSRTWGGPRPPTAEHR
ncbi:Bifunctional DNA primase/polymerase, N-terminal [Streptoalloteichus hindustanus]|uniref:Bifunctional DNA primase/polymerase, N-terminal n=2 Tax=Streptoalloteichus hindustanus TaxID=2017 RepID=A0A1M5CTQ4_STRHI|nr:Bifunctional DNA primase/polymerase, N-terminal [Streptoalloteichus hindustanus]